MAGCLPKATCFIFNKFSFLHDSFSDLHVISLNKYLLATYCVPDTVLETRNENTSVPTLANGRQQSWETSWLGFCLLNHMGDSNFYI